MAEALNIGKNNLQCRSHHQKMLAKHKSVEKIITVLMKQDKSDDSETDNKVSECLTVPEFKLSVNSAWTFYAPSWLYNLCFPLLTLLNIPASY